MLTRVVKTELISRFILLENYLFLGINIFFELLNSITNMQGCEVGLFFNTEISHLYQKFIIKLCFFNLLAYISRLPKIKKAFKISGKNSKYFNLKKSSNGNPANK